VGRTIVFGDIHACHEEWKELLDRLAVGGSDKLVAVGDLVCKGPSTRSTLDLAMSLPNLTCLVGNHELRLLESWKAGQRPDGRPGDAETAREMGERYEAQMAYMASWPFYLDLPELLVVHAGVRPGLPVEKQSQQDLTHLRRVGPDERPWYELYEGRKPVAFGHWVRREPLLTEKAIGLDTGCVYGGRLSAYVLPDRKVESVAARRAYAAKKGDWA
jgi:serine/threonine protein phosphatase 1